LIAVAGEAAIAIVLILACVNCELPVLFIRYFVAKITRDSKRNALCPTTARRVLDCRCAAPEFCFGAWD
jgi:hypothetical protein